MSDKRTLILGSSSKWRAQVLEGLGARFETMAPDIDEKAIRYDDPMALTLAIANAKVEALFERMDRPALIICADQVAVFEGEIREKPRDVDEARRWLKSYSSATVETVTAIAVADFSTGVVYDGADVARVSFREIGGPAIAHAIVRGDVLNSCGAFTIDDPAIKPLVASIEGTKDSVDGLPIPLLRDLLHSHGYRLP